MTHQLKAGVNIDMQTTPKEDDHLNLVIFANRSVKVLLKLSTSFCLIVVCGSVNFLDVHAWVSMYTLYQYIHTYLYLSIRLDRNEVPRSDSNWFGTPCQPMTGSPSSLAIVEAVWFSVADLQPFSIPMKTSAEHMPCQEIGIYSCSTSTPTPSQGLETEVDVNGGFTISDAQHLYDSLYTSLQMIAIAHYVCKVYTVIRKRNRERAVAQSTY